MKLICKITLVLVAIQYIIGTSVGYVIMEMWEKRCKGGWYRNDRIEDNTCFSWPSAGGGSRGIQLLQGSCLNIFKNTGCSSSNGALTQIGECYSAHVYSARVCSRRDTTFRCPDGKILKGMEIANGGPASGLIAHCYAENEIPSELVGDFANTTVRTSCRNGIGGLKTEVDDRLQVVVKTIPVCDIKQCPDDQNVVGITASIEEHTELIKGISVICSSPRSAVGYDHSTS